MRTFETKDGLIHNCIRHIILVNGFELYVIGVHNDNVNEYYCLQVGYKSTNEYGYVDLSELSQYIVSDVSREKLNNVRPPRGCKWVKGKVLTMQSKVNS